MPTSSDPSCPEETMVSVFEHYGLFGAPLGTWTRDGALDVDPVLGGASREDTKQETYPHRSLFEHYGLFGADVGTWSDPCNVESPFDLGDVFRNWADDDLLTTSSC